MNFKDASEMPGAEVSDYFQNRTKELLSKDSNDTLRDGLQELIHYDLRETLAFACYAIFFTEHGKECIFTEEEEKTAKDEIQFCNERIRVFINFIIEHADPTDEDCEAFLAVAQFFAANSGFSPEAEASERKRQAFFPMPITTPPTAKEIEAEQQAKIQLNTLLNLHRTDPIEDQSPEINMQYQFVLEVLVDIAAISDVRTAYYYLNIAREFADYHELGEARDYADAVLAMTNRISSRHVVLDEPTYRPEILAKWHIN